MNRDKQIEEMAKNICSEYDCIIPCQSCAYYEYANCRDVKSAEKLYNAGYRKSTDLAREIFEEIEKNMVAIDDIDFNHFRAIGRRTFAELKKKYTKSEDTE